MEFNAKTIYQLSGEDLIVIMDSVVKMTIESTLSSIKPVRLDSADGLLSIDEAAVFLGVSKGSITNYYKAGKLEFIRVGEKNVRFTKEMLLTFVEKRT